MAMRLLELNNNSFALPSLMSLYSVVYATRLFCTANYAFVPGCGDLVTKFLDPPKWDLPMNFELPRPSKLALPMLKWVSSISHLASGTPTSKKIAARGIHPTG